MTYSAVLIVPAAIKPQADAIGKAIGWGDVSYTIALGDGETITHYGARADVSAQFVGWVRGEHPLPDAAFAPVIAGIIADFSPNPDPAEDSAPVVWGKAHLDRVLGATQLIRM
jgi:hypothetical protein